MVLWILEKLLEKGTILMNIGKKMDILRMRHSNKTFGEKYEAII